jgi:hypothetical protein
MGKVLTATCHMGALDDRITEYEGSNVADEFLSQLLEIFLIVEEV